MGSGGNESAAAGNAGYDGPATATSPGSGKAENANAGRGGNGKGGRGRGPSSVSFGGKSYATVTDRYGNNISDGFGNPVASGMEVNGLSANGKPSMDRARGRRGGTLAAGASLTDDQLGQMIGAALNDVKGKTAGISKGSVNAAKAGKASLLGLSPNSVSLSDEEMAGVSKNSRTQGFVDKANDGIANSLGNLIGKSGNMVEVKGGKYGVANKTSVGRMTAVASAIPFPGAAGWGWAIDKLGNNPFGTIESRSSTSLDDLENAKNAVPGSKAVSAKGQGQKALATSKKKVTKFGSRGNAGVGVPSTQAPSISFLSDDDDLFSLYRRMLSGYFKGAKV
ncbi:MAG: hypothetical protein GY832_17525 [Chloroflexi bacterium]|nr:hypothetical protein [Chloroflexota bacterium]